MIGKITFKLSPGLNLSYHYLSMATFRMKTLLLTIVEPAFPDLKGQCHIHRAAENLMKHLEKKAR